MPFDYTSTIPNFLQSRNRSGRTARRKAAAPKAPSVPAVRNMQLPWGRAEALGQFSVATRQFGTGPVVPETFAPQPPQPPVPAGAGRPPWEVYSDWLADQDELQASRAGRAGITEAAQAQWAQARAQAPTPWDVGTEAMYAANPQLAGPGELGSLQAHNAAIRAGGAPYASRLRALEAGGPLPFGMGGRKEDFSPVVGQHPWQPTLPDLGPRAGSVERDLDTQAIAKARLQAGRAMERDSLYLGSDDESDMGPVTLQAPSADPELNKKRAAQIGNYTDRMRSAMDALKKAAKAQVSGDKVLYDQQVAVAAAAHPGPMGRDSPFAGDAAEIRKKRQADRQRRLGLPTTPEGRTAVGEERRANLLAKTTGIPRERRAMQQLVEGVATRQGKPGAQGAPLDPVAAGALFGPSGFAAATQARTQAQIGKEDPRAAAAALYDLLQGGPETPQSRALKREQEETIGGGPSVRMPTQADWDEAKTINPADPQAVLRESGFSDEEIEESSRKLSAYTQREAIEEYERVGTHKDPQFFVPGWGLGRILGRMAYEGLMPKPARLPKGKKVPKGMTR